jgi:hypothetical protein
VDDVRGKLPEEGVDERRRETMALGTKRVSMLKIDYNVCVF